MMLQKRRVVRSLPAQGVLEPERVEQKMIEEHGEPLGHGVIPQALPLESRVRRHVGEMKRMAEFVPERAVIIITAPGSDDEVNLLGHAAGRRKRRGDS